MLDFSKYLLGKCLFCALFLPCLPSVQSLSLCVRCLPSSRHSRPVKPHLSQGEPAWSLFNHIQTDHSVPSVAACSTDRLTVLAPSPVRLDNPSCCFVPHNTCTRSKVTGDWRTALDSANLLARLALILLTNFDQCSNILHLNCCTLHQH